ncbi:MAG: hypothetical protein LBF34_03995 [Puniceicoccales bacterium]|jgi:ribonuclease BN (tRNA processing enzyme)|nr:hypothetical protein [Puniceicoccales bacterium]
MLKLPFWQKYLVYGCFCLHIVILWGDVDVYVYNVGPGNFVRVLFDVQQPQGIKKELIIDCGSTSGKSIIENKVENFSNTDIRESMLWITHLHIDHYNGLCGSQSSILRDFYNRIGKIIIGGAITQATQCLKSNQWWEKKNKETDV